MTLWSGRLETETGWKRGLFDREARKSRRVPWGLLVYMEFTRITLPLQTAWHDRRDVRRWPENPVTLSPPPHSTLFDYENVSLDYAGCQRAIANLPCDPAIPLEGRWKSARKLHPSDEGSTTGSPDR